MPEYELQKDVAAYVHAPEPKERGDAHDVEPAAVSSAIAHGRPETLGPAGAFHVQRAAGNAAMTSLVQRSEDEGESPVHSALRSSSGSPLPDATKEKMEGAFGVDFSDVRVHTGSQAADAATSVQAQAFTVGRDIFFNEGHYSEGSPSTERTLAHELTHVVQQATGPVDGTSVGGGIKVSDPGDPYEQQAERTADAVMSGDHSGHAHAGEGGGGASVQREAEEEELQQLPLQRQEEPEEEELQTLALQRQEEEPEEEVQTLALQRQEEPEEEELQALALQRQEEPEEEEMPA